jgi:hypothetical protein
VIIKQEDFEGDFPGDWFVKDNNGTAYGEYYWAKSDCQVAEGDYSGWAVGGGVDGASLPCGSEYADKTSSWMRYGPFSLAGATAAEVALRLWVNPEPGFDALFFGVSTNGTNFYGNSLKQNSGGWIDGSLDLSSVPTLGNLLGKTSVWLAVAFSSDDLIHYPEGAYVDNIVLRKCTVAHCEAVGASPGSPGTQRLGEPASMTLGQ